MPFPPMVPLRKKDTDKKIAAAKARAEKKRAKEEYEAAIVKFVDLAQKLNIEKEDAVFGVIQEFEEREE